MKKVVIVILMFLSSCGRNYTVSHSYTSKCNEGAINTTITKLISRPDYYNGKVVQVTGIYRLLFEMSALFPTEKSSEKSEAIWVEFKRRDSLINSVTGINFLDQNEYKTIRDRRIKLIGVFNSKDKGHLDDYGGTIEDICFCEVYQDSK